MLLIFAPPLRIVGGNWEIRYDSFFTAGKAATGLITLAALYSAWAGGTADIYQIFQFYLFGVPIVPTVLGSWGHRVTPCLVG